MGGTFRVPANGLTFSAGPSVRDSHMQLRVPFIEQLGAQFGAAFSRKGRPLLPREISIARSVFEDSLNYDVIRVVTASFANAPTTLGNYVRIEHSGQLDESTLVHELTHVWQYQTHGIGYISNSMCAQLLGALQSGSRNVAYTVSAAQLAQIRSFSDLSAERQARTIELYYVNHLLRHPDQAKRSAAKQRFKYLMRDLADPDFAPEEFKAECADLDRLIAQVRGARPMPELDRYLESMYGHAGGQRAARGLRLEGASPTFSHGTSPIFRLEF